MAERLKHHAARPAAPTGSSPIAQTRVGLRNVVRAALLHTYALSHVIPRSDSDEESVCHKAIGSFASLRMTNRNTGPGVLSEVAPPVPIPNTEVKRPSADDTRVGNPPGK